MSDSHDPDSHDSDSHDSNGREPRASNGASPRATANNGQTVPSPPSVGRVAAPAVSVVRRSISSAMDEFVGLRESGLLEVLESKLSAKRKVFAVNGGVFTDEREVDDNPTQIRALNMALTLRNAYPAKQLDVGVNVSVEQLPDLSHLPTRELMKLAGYASDDPPIDADIVDEE